MKTKGKTLLSWVICTLMLVSAMPLSAWASGIDDGEELLEEGVSGEEVADEVVAGETDADDALAEEAEETVVDDERVESEEDVETDGSSESVETADTTNANHYELMTIDGNTISTKADGKPRVIVFFKRDCWNSENVLSQLKNVDLDIKAIDFLAAEFCGASLSEVKEIYSRLGSEQITFCYDARSVAWKQIRELIPSASRVTSPFIIYESSNGEIEGYTMGDVDILSEIATRLGVEAESPIQGLKVASHTQQEIREKLLERPASLKDTVAYTKKPNSNPPYELGEISKSSKNSSLNMLNNIRYIAGLHDDITLEDSLGDYAQAAALVNAANDVMTHYPERPSSMDDTLYQMGKTGAQASNLGRGYSNINVGIVSGWMNDGDDRNIDRVGHRRWILNPSMGKTGFGMVGKHTAMYALDRSGDGTERMVAWPAQQMPIELFGADYPWSISVGKSISSDNITIKLKRIDDGKIWNFGKGIDISAANSGYWNVETESYGVKGCIIFRPNNISYSAGQKYEVVISGAISQEIEYSVEFFALNIPSLGSVYDKKSTSGSTTNWTENIFSGATKSFSASNVEKGVQLAWKKVPGATGYYIYRNKSLLQVIKKGSVTSTIDKTAKNGKSYEYYIVACAQTGKSKRSVYTYIYRLDMPVITKTTRASNKRMKISWKKNKKASGYEIQYSTSKKFRSGNKEDYVTGSTAVIRGLKKKKTYYVRIRAYKYADRFYLSSWSKARSFRVK